MRKGTDLPKIEHMKMVDATNAFIRDWQLTREMGGREMGERDDDDGKGTCRSL